VQSVLGAVVLAAADKRLMRVDRKSVPA